MGSVGAPVVIAWPLCRVDSVVEFGAWLSVMTRGGTCTSLVVVTTFVGLRICTPRVVRENRRLGEERPVAGTSPARGGRRLGEGTALCAGTSTSPWAWRAWGCDQWAGYP